jgi:opacity protein-like surface antigen
MKKLFTILCAAVLTLSMSAQTQYGVVGGLNIASVSGSDLDDMYEYQAFINGLSYDGLSTRLGIRLGMSADLALSDAVTLKTGVLYSVKGYSGVMGGVDFDQSLNYIELPVNFSFAISDQFSLMGGFYSAFLVGTSLTVDGKDEPADTDGMSAIDVGIGLGAEISVSDAISINAGYQMGITAIDDDGDFDTKNSNILIGMTYHFGG